MKVVLTTDGVTVDGRSAGRIGAKYVFQDADDTWRCFSRRNLRMVYVPTGGRYAPGKYFLDPKYLRPYDPNRAVQLRTRPIGNVKPAVERMASVRQWRDDRVSLTPYLAAIARSLGDGDVTEGIRRALLECDRYGLTEEEA